jgi:hypothetical protein
VTLKEIDSIGGHTTIPKPNILCAAKFIVRPNMDLVKRTGNFSDDELFNTSSSVASVVQQKTGTSNIISESDEDAVTHCKAELIVIEILSYSTKPACKGEKEGTVSVKVTFYSNMDKKNIIQQKSFTGQGKCDYSWGDSRPMSQAFEKLCKQIERGL